MKLNLEMNIHEIKDKLADSIDGNAKVHEMDVYEQNFQLVKDGLKQVEIRLNKGYKVGDYILMREYDIEEEKYTGEVVLVKITYTTSYSQIGNNVVVGFAPVSLSLSIK